MNSQAEGLKPAEAGCQLAYASLGSSQAQISICTVEVSLSC
jgi:hypothetical protein